MSGSYSYRYYYSSSSLIRGRSILLPLYVFVSPFQLSRQPKRMCYLKDRAPHLLIWHSRIPSLCLLRATLTSIFLRSQALGWAHTSNSRRQNNNSNNSSYSSSVNPMKGECKVLRRKEIRNEARRRVAERTYLRGAILGRNNLRRYVRFAVLGRTLLSVLERIGAELHR